MASVPPDEAPIVTGDRTRTLADVFDNEALWNADDTDDYILMIASDVAAALSTPAIALADAGGNSLLHMAAIWNRPKVMEALILRGIELNDKNASCATPLDLATHYGNIDLALQLRHYGAKHTCESDRDLAIAQRDLAQLQLRDTNTDLADALGRLKATKQEREELRVERDRLVLENETLKTQRDALATNEASLQHAVDALTKENQELLLQAAQMREALACESHARLNATQSWHAAQQVITELQERELAFQAREADANRMRDDARTDRDVARELAKLAQLDVGKARQAQMEAEQARDVAVHKQLEAEHAIATEKDLWAKRIAKTERDRKNIQIEIDRQTDALRKECDRLEKQLRAATTLMWTLREEIAEKVAVIEGLEGDVEARKAAQQRLEAAATEHERHIAVLEQAQESEHQAWRNRLEKALREEADHAMRRIVGEVATTAECVAAHEQTLRRLALSMRREFLLQPELTSSLYMDCRSLSPSPSSMSIGKKAQATTLLPLLPDRASSASAHGQPSPTATRSLGTAEAPSPELADAEDFEFHPAPADMAAIVSSARAATHFDMDELTFPSVVDLVTSLTDAVQKHMDASASFVTRNWRHFRKQVQALEKMVERKDELIDRFNQHRRDKPKRQPARLRECLYRPQI